MKVVYKKEKEIVLVFKKGDDYNVELKSFLEKENINSAFFYGIGAFLDAEIAYYNLDSNEYENKKIKGPLEVASLMGNISQMDDELIIHNHVVLGDRDFKTYSGHLVNGVVAGTLEIKLTVLDNELKRLKDEETGLNLIS
ncbi:MAG: DUF296 domain-containing protein, partial [Candidatus Paceibacterota bacterium]